MPQKKVTPKPRDGEIRHYVNTRFGDLAEFTERTTRRIVAEEIAVAVLGLEGFLAGKILNERKQTEENINSVKAGLKIAIATAHLGKVQIVNENCTGHHGVPGWDCRTMQLTYDKWCPSCKEFSSNQAHLGKLPVAGEVTKIAWNAECARYESADCRASGRPRDQWCQSCLYAAQPVSDLRIDARPLEPISSPDTPYVLISIYEGNAEVDRMVGKVDVDVFDWDIVTAAINENDGYILSDREIQYLKEEDEQLYNKYMAQKYEASMGPAIVRAKLVENWLEEPNSAVLKALQQRGWNISTGKYNLCDKRVGNGYCNMQKDHAGECGIFPPCAKCHGPKESSRPNSIFCRSCDKKN